MSIFEPYVITWGGQDYIIPPDRILKAIAVVEQHVTLHEMMEVMAKRQTVKMGTMAAAYGALLRFVGVKTSDEDVYLAFFETGEGAADTIVSAIRGLQMLMIPPASFKGDPTGKAPDERKAAARSSRKPSKRPAGQRR